MSRTSSPFLNSYSTCEQEPGCDSCRPTTQELHLKELFNYGCNVSTQPVSQPSFASAYLKLERSPAAPRGLHCHPERWLCSPSWHPLSKTAAGLLYWALSACPALRKNLLHREHESPISLNSTYIWTRGENVLQYLLCNSVTSTYCTHVSTCTVYTPFGPSDLLLKGFVHEECSLPLCQPQAFTSWVVFGAHNVFVVSKKNIRLSTLSPLEIIILSQPWRVPPTVHFTGATKRLCKDHLCICLSSCVRHCPCLGPLTWSQQLDELMLI